MKHHSEWTGLLCRREEITGSPCDGIGHVSVAYDQPDYKATHEPDSQG